jgi:DNA-binding CsgD family transcriptional regulator
MFSALFVSSFILNSMGTVTITYLVYYFYKYKAKSLLYLLASLSGLLCSGVSYSFYLVNLSSLSFEYFKTIFFLFFSFGYLTFAVFFYVFIVKKFLLRTYKPVTNILFICYFFSIACSIFTIVLPVIWTISLSLSLFSFILAVFLSFTQLLFLQSKLQFEKQDIFFKLLTVSFLLLAIAILSEIIHFFITKKVSSFSPILYLLNPFFFFLILKNQSLYYQKQEIENPEKIKIIFDQFNLSGKEQEIAMQILQGKSNKEISFDMSISNSTVKSHIYSIYKKVHVQSRVQFVNLVMLRM